MKSINTSLKFGFLTAVILILYFLFLGLLGLNTIPAFSFVNAAICAVGISLSIKNLKEKRKQGMDYITGFKTGLLTGIFATIVFAIFFISYYVYNEAFSQALIENIGLSVDTGLMFLTVTIMGIASTLVVTLALMQLHKKKISQA